MLPNRARRPDAKLTAVICRSRLLTALRAGLITQLLTTFVVLLVMVPWHAAQNEFPGHEHPPGTPDHVHALEQVVGWLMTGTLLAVIITSLPHSGHVEPRPASWHEVLSPARVNGSRAPPVLTVRA